MLIRTIGGRMRARALLVGILLAPALGAQSAALDAALQSLLDSPALDGARIGVSVVDAGSDVVLCTHDAGFGFLPASNLKLITIAAALVQLGPAFRFVTRVGAHGEIRDGTLDGDLALVGAGDPTLDGAALDGLAAQLAALGLREVRGRVLGDDDCHPDTRYGAGWAVDDEGKPWCAQLAGLCFADNTVRVRAAPGENDDDPLRVSLDPDVGYVRIDNRARTAAGSLLLERQPNTIVVRGALPRGAPPHEDRFAIDNPTAYAARAFVHALAARGIAVRGGAFDRDEVDAAPTARAQVIARHDSPPLAGILRTLGKESQNLYAEQVARAMPTPATASLQNLGIPIGGLQLADGSGLSRENLVRPRALTALLAAMHRGAHRADFVATLPVAGVDGTLAHRFPDGPARGRVRAKTGTLGNVAALSGYVPRRDPLAPPLAFAVIVNGFTTPREAVLAAVDRFVGELAAHAGW